MTSVRTQVVQSLADKEYRDEYVSEHIAQGVAFQIRAMRRDRGWSQAQLGNSIGMAQEYVSKVENPDYGKYTLATLKRMAAAFDVALTVRFVPFSQLVDWTTRISPADLAVPSFGADAGLLSGTYGLGSSTRPTILNGSATPLGIIPASPDDGLLHFPTYRIGRDTTPTYKKAGA